MAHSKSITGNLELFVALTTAAVVASSYLLYMLYVFTSAAIYIVIQFMGEHEFSPRIGVCCEMPVDFEPIS